VEASLCSVGIVTPLKDGQGAIVKQVLISKAKAKAGKMISRLFHRLCFLYDVGHDQSVFKMEINMAIEFFDITKDKIQRRIATEENAQSWIYKGLDEIEICHKGDGQYFATASEAHAGLISSAKREIVDSDKEISIYKRDESLDAKKKVDYWTINKTKYKNLLQVWMTWTEPKVD